MLEFLRSHLLIISLIGFLIIVVLFLIGLKIILQEKAETKALKQELAELKLLLKDVRLGWVLVDGQWHQISKRSNTINEASDFFIDGVRCNLTNRLFTY